MTLPDAGRGDQPEPDAGRHGDADAVRSRNAQARCLVKAAACTGYGPPEVVEIRDVPTPAPGDGEVLVKAAATTVNSGDARLRALNVPRGMRVPARLRLGLTKLRQPILGFEMVGRVQAVGAGVSGVQSGERVVVSRGFKMGCHAEFAVVSARGR